MNNKFSIKTVIAFVTLFVQYTVCQIPQYDHVVIVVMENHDVEQIVGSPYAPYINSLIADSSCAFFTQSFGLAHPSQPNYLYLFSGSNQGVISNEVPQDFPFTTPNLGASLRSKGFSFLGFAEDMPVIGFTEASSGLYVRKHNPWVNWQGVGENGIPPECNLPFTYFPRSYSTLPTVSIVVPNLENDMHNGDDDSIRITGGDIWLKNNFDEYIQWTKNNNSLFILTFDENNFTPENHITTLFIGTRIKQGQYDRPITHNNVLRTIEKIYGITPSGPDSLNCSIGNCWNTASTNLSAGKEGRLVHYSLHQNFPNPFNPSTTINYQLPINSFITLKVFDVLGREVATLKDELQSAGEHSIQWNASNISSGIYFYTLRAGNYLQTKRMIMAK